MSNVYKAIVKHVILSAVIWSSQGNETSGIRDTQGYLSNFVIITDPAGLKSLVGVGLGHL